MKPVLLLIGAVIIILLMPAMLLSINSFRMADQEDEYIIPLTSPDVSAVITLSQGLFDDATYNVSLSSNVTADAPIASGYVATTKALTVTGLETDTTRRLTVDYKIAALDSYWGADTGAKTWPMFLILGVLGIIVGAVYTATRHGGD